MNEAEFRTAATAAFELHRAGRLNEAETAYRKILEARPDTPEILQLLGTLLGQANRLEDARKVLERAIEIQPANADAHYNLAECLHRLGNATEACEAYRSAITARPAHVEAAIGLSGLLLAAGDADAAVDITHAALPHATEHPALLGQLGASLLTAGRPEEARGHLEKATRLAPDFVLAQRNLAMALIQLEEFDAALTLLRPLVNAEPRSIELLQLAAMALSASGQHARARPAAERILEIEPDNVTAIDLLRDIAANLGDGDLAVGYGRQAVALAPDSADAAARLAELLERMSLLDEAREWVERALSWDPQKTRACMVAARLDRRSGDNGGALAFLEKVDTGKEPPWLAANILFERGQVLEALDRHDTAFTTFEDAHAARAQTRQARACDPDKHARTQEALLALFEAESAPSWIAGWPDEPIADGFATPCFLTGYPRSGTTLVERLLDAHDRVTATPEFPMVNAMCNALDTAAPGGNIYPDALAHVGAEEIARLRMLYRELLEESHDGPTGDRLVVDKHPLNLDHLGLIARAFPGAKVIVALRDPRDVCMSCFTTDFIPNNVTMRFFDLPETARAYAATMRLWLLYRDILPLDFFVYRYEDLVRDPRTVLGQIVAFLGLEWHDSLLESAGANVGRYVSTPSYTGVTQSVNTRAVGRWEGYAEMLEPVMPILQPYIEAFGYGDPADD
ncbi:MAG: sulfotransferase [Alphaproteobacteria bacterium]